ncbi:aldehyde dehydrogenase (NADP(+)) [Compostibacter hankyongensis]|uniref:Aldehyde dehydrogenase (NADP(+)) n=1 Tax=Compostibacter hankyongensis TaxID=1007089 RepID=A0ABP8G7X1_9BACT
MTYNDATQEEITRAMETAWSAFQVYRNFSLKQRADFMRAIAEALEALKETVVPVAMEETSLPRERLAGELGRTVFQLRSYAAAAEKGEWLEARIDTAVPDRTPAPKPDLRKMLVPLGPVVVFGASNFPFAYSTAGGDTACALAAGCPVIVKAHPAHAHTSELVAGAILQAAEATHMPPGIFNHIHGAGFEVGEMLVNHPHTKAVGFTGSQAGGKALFDLAAKRKEPIPVFAEMGSINPVFLLPGKLEKDAETVAAQYAASITQGVGQFCTNPGLLIGIKGETLNRFTELLGKTIRETTPAPMLHAGIARAFHNHRSTALAQLDVKMVAVSAHTASEHEGAATLATAPGDAFLQNPVLHQEVFGPYSLVIQCRDAAQMLEVARRLEGQLTHTLMATEEDLHTHADLLNEVREHCGRLIINGVPTGVEVALAMHHGGPYPATTDSRFTAVGADGIKRFARPLCLQNFPDGALPDELKNGNPLGIWRTVNNELTREAIA